MPLLPSIFGGMFVLGQSAVDALIELKFEGSPLFMGEFLSFFQETVV